MWGMQRPRRCLGAGAPKSQTAIATVMVMSKRGVCGGDCLADDDDDGICDGMDECVGELDECGECNGQGAVYECGCDKIQDGECDCDGNILDVLGECGGGCMADVDTMALRHEDGCVGHLDACRVCNGPGAVYECGCNDLQDGECDCWQRGRRHWICVEVGDFDMDFDGICDDEDDCIGTLDACGICNGADAIYPCGCDLIPVGDCDCEGNQVDAVDDNGGDCTEDLDADGISDDVDSCVETSTNAASAMALATSTNAGATTFQLEIVISGNQLDASRCVAGHAPLTRTETGCATTWTFAWESSTHVACQRPGAAFECGCADIPAEDCDCNGNQLDALGVCGGTCAADTDEDGVCDNVDSCVEEVDECGVCNGPGAVLECGCNIVIPGFAVRLEPCDALGVCGGTCTADEDDDGVCDDVDDCVGEFGMWHLQRPGEVYDCGCDDIPAGGCDCEGNQLDALDVCGGTCTEDADEDGVCDDVDSALSVRRMWRVQRAWRGVRMRVRRPSSRRLRLRRKPARRLGCAAGLVQPTRMTMASATT